MLISLMALALVAAPQDAAPAPTERPKVQCAKGPASKTYAGLPWLAYGCSDNASVLLVAPKDNPVNGMSFVLAKSGEGYAVYGQGTAADQAAGKAADMNFRAWTPAQLVELAREVNGLS